MAKLAVSLLASTALAAPFAAGAAFAGELPNGASVASGQVSIGTSGSAMTVTQGSDRAIVNWNGFSVGQGNSVTFVQPGTSSAILNRVTGSTKSSIAGSISANGQVYLVNPNGIAITSTGTVKVGGGFVASTLDIGDDDFLKGNLSFNGNGASAGVANEGVVSVGRGGYAALIGGTVKNDGLIAVPMGEVGLGSGEQATLNLSGDGFLQVAVPTVAGAEGNGALIENSGTISADGGTVVMKAATARDAARQAINLTGVAEAKTVSGKTGEIVIGGGEGGAVTMSGKAVATGKSAKNDKGGKITVTGRSVALKGATVDASGAAGGGTVKIGGDWQGSGDTQRAKTTSVDAASTIRADATEAGNGGTIVVWSDDFTNFAGTITARGAGTGNGGNAEVSGKALLGYSGLVDLFASSGTFGNLLLDPYNLTISSATSAGMSGLSANGNDSVLNIDTLTTALATANVTVSTGASGTQDGNITIASPVAWSANTVLTLAAAGNIVFNSAVTATGANAGVVIEYGVGKGYTVNAPITLSGASATLQIGETGNLQAYTLIHDMAALDNIDVTGLAGKYALAQDLDASGTTYANAVVAGTFTGSFTGLGHTISNLTINAAGIDGVGLFAKTGSAALISNIGLIDVDVIGNGAVGGLVGSNAGKVSQSYSAGSVIGDYSIGGLVGYSNGVVSQSYATGSVGGNKYIGGLIGESWGGVSQSYASGGVSGNEAVGGLVGRGGSDNTISQSYAGNAVPLVGYNSSTLITGSQSLNAAQMNDPFTFINAGWDFTSTWATLKTGGGPVLRSLTTADVYNYYVSISGDATTTYGELASTDSIAVGGLGAGNVTIDWGSGISTSTGAGTYNLNYGDPGVLSMGYSAGTTADYYVKYGAGTLTVNKAALTVTANDASKTYDGLSYSGGNGVSYSGFVNNETSTVLGGALAYGGTSQGAQNAGTYGITASGLTSGNYTISYAAGDLTVDKAALTVTANDALKTYDGLAYNGSSGVAYSGLVNSETSTVLGGTLAYDSGTDAGFYTITTSGLTSGNYSITYVAGDLTVEKAALTVTANDASKTYDGLAYSGGGVTYDGFVNSETSAVLGGSLAYGGTAQGATNAGTYDITASGLTSGNYDISYAAGGLTVDKASLTVTANDASKTYDGLAYNGGNGVTYSGFVNNETSAVLGGTLSYSGPAQGAVDAGTYRLGASGLTSGNYAIRYADGAMTITAAGPGSNPNPVFVPGPPPQALVGNLIMPQWTSPLGQQAIVYASSDGSVGGSQSPSMRVEDTRLSGASCSTGVTSNQTCTGSTE